MSFRNWDVTNSHSCPNINSQPHHHKPATSGTNRNSDAAATIPGANGAVPAARWPRPDPADHCTVAKRSYTRPDTHTTGSSCPRLTTGNKWPTRHETMTKSSIFVASLVSSPRISINNYVNGALLWNNLRQEMRDANSIGHFK